jgi:hypothetical protein
MGLLAQKVLGISLDEVSFDRRRFRGFDQPARPHLEEAGRSFITGYMAALSDDRLGPLMARLSQVPAERRGFAFEGAAMGLALLDFFKPWRRSRFHEFYEGPGQPHTYLLLVGKGWAMARLPGSVDKTLARLDPLLRWLALDGYGFHEGFFHWPQAIDGQKVPKRVSGYGARAFDQGVGRSLWFVEGAAPDRIAATIGRFPEPRQGDLWSGVGLACGYAGGIGRAAVERLAELAGPHLLDLAQGVAFAAAARQRAGNLTAASEIACDVVWGSSAGSVADIAVTAGLDLPDDGPELPFEIWRQRIQKRLEERLEPCSSDSRSSARTA